MPSTRGLRKLLLCLCVTLCMTKQKGLANYQMGLAIEIQSLSCRNGVINNIAKLTCIYTPHVIHTTMLLQSLKLLMTNNLYKGKELGLVFAHWHIYVLLSFLTVDLISK